jgi:predicted O-methyltransferase YrrM
MNELKTLTQAANGMLPAEVYQAIFETVSKRECENIVEIGTAHGAATISLALGAVSRGGRTTVWSVDRLGGRHSSRSAFGSPTENERIVIANLSRAKVDHLVRLFVGSSDEFVSSGQCPDKIDLLLLDADGRIERDLMHFYGRLPPGAPVIIDDADSSIYLNRNHEGLAYIDCKHRATALLLDGFCHEGYLQIKKRLGNTAFCERTSKNFDRGAFMEVAVNAYRELVFADVDDSYWKELSSWNDKRAEVREAVKISNALPRSAVMLAKRLRRIVRSLVP